MSFLGEIKRRKVFQVAAVYAVVAWVAVQIVATVEAPLNLPDWVDTVVIVLLAVGFPIAIVLAWAFDMTPQGVVAASDSSAGQVSATPAVNRFSYISQGLVLVAVGFLVLDQYVLSPLDLSSPEESRPVTRVLLTPPETAPLDLISFGNSLAISPDGTRVVYRGLLDESAALFRRDLADLTATPIASNLGRIRELAISPDSNWIAVFNESDLYRLSIEGGPAVPIVEGYVGFPRGVTWGPDDTIIFATSSPEGLMRVPAGGGEVETLTSIEMQGVLDHIQPKYLPGGNAVLFTLQAEDGSLRSSQIAVLSLDDLQIKVLVTGGTDPSYLSTGHIVYGWGDTLRAVGFDLDLLEVTTDPYPVVNELLEAPSGAVNYSVSENGSLVYLRGVGIAPGEMSLVWINRDGSEEPLALAPGNFRWPRISPDGTRIVLEVEVATDNLWVFDLVRETISPVTTTSVSTGIYQNRSAIWTPDSERLVYTSLNSQIGWTLVENSWDGTGEASLVLTNEPGGNLQPYGWSPDGSQIVFDYGGRPTLDIGVLTVGGDVQWEPLFDSEAGEAAPAISPDGNWIAYSSNRSDRCEIYVEQFPGLGNRRQVSTNGGAAPVWGPDGSELFFLEDSERLMSVSINYEGGFNPASAELVADGLDLSGIWNCFSRHYDISPDGERFIFLRPVAGTAQTVTQTDLVLELNWLEELKRLVPTE